MNRKRTKGKSRAKSAVSSPPLTIAQFETFFRTVTRPVHKPPPEQEQPMFEAVLASADCTRKRICSGSPEGTWRLQRGCPTNPTLYQATEPLECVRVNGPHRVYLAGVVNPEMVIAHATKRVIRQHFIGVHDAALQHLLAPCDRPGGGGARTPPR